MLSASGTAASDTVRAIVRAYSEIDGAFISREIEVAVISRGGLAGFPAATLEQCAVRPDTVAVRAPGLRFPARCRVFYDRSGGARLWTSPRLRAAIGIGCIEGEGIFLAPRADRCAAEAA